MFFMEAKVRFDIEPEEKVRNIKENHVEMIRPQHERPHMPAFHPGKLKNIRRRYQAKGFGRNPHEQPPVRDMHSDGYQSPEPPTLIDLSDIASQCATYRGSTRDESRICLVLQVVQSSCLNWRHYGNASTQRKDELWRRWMTSDIKSERTRKVSYSCNLYIPATAKPELLLDLVKVRFNGRVEFFRLRGCGIFSHHGVSPS